MSVSIVELRNVEIKSTSSTPVTFATALTGDKMFRLFSSIDVYVSINGDAGPDTGWFVPARTSFDLCGFEAEALSVVAANAETGTARLARLIHY